MEYIYNFNGKRVTLNEIKDDIINDWVNTNKTKKEIHKIYPVGTETLAKVLKGIKKEYCECYECGEKDINEFYPTNKILCKKCRSKKVSVYNKNYYNNLSEDEKVEKLLKTKKWQHDNFIKIRLLGAKHRAKIKNIEFDIDEQYIKNLMAQQNNRCKYSNVELELTMGSENTYVNHNTLSIDRINPKLGYVKGNIALVSAIVNTMKNEQTETNFLNVINLIHENYKKNFNTILTF